MTARKLKIYDTESAPAKGQESPMIVNPAPNIESLVRFEGLHRRFRAVISQVVPHLERIDPADRSRLDFVKRLFKAWQILKDPTHSATPQTLWSALHRFEAEVTLAECELECLQVEIAASTGRSPCTPRGQCEVLLGSRLVPCNSDVPAVPVDG
jgi:hypothetical protein